MICIGGLKHLLYVFWGYGKLPVYRGCTALSGVFSLMVSASLRKKILWGIQTSDSLGDLTKKIIGGHFRGIIGHPDYAVEIVGESICNPGCIKVKYYKLLVDGQISRLKSPKSTLFPRRWRKDRIIHAIHTIANSAKSVHRIESDGSVYIRGIYRDLYIELIVRDNQITAAYPL